MLYYNASAIVYPHMCFIDVNTSNTCRGGIPVPLCGCIQQIGEWAIYNTQMARDAEIE